MGVEVGGAAPCYLQVVGGGDGRRSDPSGVTAAAGQVHLHAVDGVGCHHVGEIVDALDIVPCRDVGVAAVADFSQAGKVVG